MINAIYIQSFFQEIENGDLLWLLRQKALKKTSLPIIIFLDWKSKDDVYTNKLSSFLQKEYLGKNIKVIYVMDICAPNPTTFMFRFIMNFESSKYKKVLLLESDCYLKDNCIDLLSLEISKTKEPWFIYGSFYRGTIQVSNSNHMNGVGIYNRTNEFLNFVNECLLSNLWSRVNYDMILDAEATRLNFYLNRVIDSAFILNLSPIQDKNLKYKQFKPKAVVIHQKKS